MHYKLTLHDSSFEDDAWLEVEKSGATPLYSEEENGRHVLYIEKKGPMPSYSWADVEKTTLAEINWEEQWQLHAPGFSDGKLMLELKNGACIYLKPGKGFGDLSHPTTKLMIKAMEGLAENQDVVDIGSGSGILSFAACALGAKSVLGLDIDQDAVDHATQNIAFNAFEVEPVFKHSLNDKFEIKSGSVGLMNMIAAEQEMAMASLQKFLDRFKVMVTSGVLAGDADEYLQKMTLKGFHLEKRFEEEGWAAFIFKV